MGRHLKGMYNVGLLDYRKGENILESYDFQWGQWGYLAPLLLVVKDGGLFQLPQKNFDILYYTEALHSIEATASYKSGVYYPRNELNIFWEYACKDLGKMAFPGKFDKKIKEYFGMEPEDHYFLDTHILLPLFNEGVGDKLSGKRLIFYFILPFLIINLLALYFILKCIYKVIFGGKRTTTSQVRGPANHRPTSREKRDKVE